ncbi:hypothetical protein [Microvirgula aerodenitrificans]|uniref:hypothetical protein n=1 Tax=Microvirgula aerodenitrificans TaxID=57480 RepID=UPI0028EFF1AD|nr:hypothetical protein [Microvirgula aerodenitrificans]
MKPVNRPACAPGAALQCNLLNISNTRLKMDIRIQAHIAQFEKHFHGNGTHSPLFFAAQQLPGRWQVAAPRRHKRQTPVDMSDRGGFGSDVTQPIGTNKS